MDRGILAGGRIGRAVWLRTSRDLPNLLRDLTVCRADGSGVIRRRRRAAVDTRDRPPCDHLSMSATVIPIADRTSPDVVDRLHREW